ncbi:MAG: hypothetical protein FWC97_03885, partial [Treponema sp.]|nr:hypothetical protein [Treponema sp.]
MAKKDNKSHAQGKDSGTSEISKKFKQSPGLYIGSVVILVLVVVTFLGGDLLQGRTPGHGGDWTFGHYNNVPISFVPGNMFHQYHDQVENWFRGQGHSLDSPHIQAQIWRQAFEMAAVHTAILNIMNRSNYAVPERTVNRIFTQLPHFQHNGLFSPALHNQMPAQRR